MNIMPVKESSRQLSENGTLLTISQALEKDGVKYDILIHLDHSTDLAHLPALEQIKKIQTLVGGCFDSLQNSLSEQQVKKIEEIGFLIPGEQDKYPRVFSVAEKTHLKAFEFLKKSEYHLQDQTDDVNWIETDLLEISENLQSAMPPKNSEGRTQTFQDVLKRIRSELNCDSITVTLTK